MNNKTAELLTTLRKNRGYTQSDLADMLGVSFQAISKWERGENLPDAQLLMELANLYGITVDEILKGNIITKDDSEKRHKRNMRILVFALGAIIISPISIFFFGVDNYQYYTPIILLVTAVSIGLIIYSQTTDMRFKHVQDPVQKRKEEIIYGICAGIFLILGLVYGLFHIAWIIFIFGYVATLIVKKD